MTPDSLIEYLFEQNIKIYPDHERDQRIVWVIGFLACIACEKNNMDNIVWEQIKHRLEQLHNKQANNDFVLVRTAERTR